MRRTTRGQGRNQEESAAAATAVSRINSTYISLTSISPTMTQSKYGTTTPPNQRYSSTMPAYKNSIQSTKHDTTSNSTLRTCDFCCPFNLSKALDKPIDFNECLSTPTSCRVEGYFVLLYVCPVRLHQSKCFFIAHRSS